MKMEMLEWLKGYISSKPLDEIKTEWKEVENQFPSGVNAFDYIKLSESKFKWGRTQNPTFENFNISNKLTSNFSGSFFLV